MRIHISQAERARYAISGHVGIGHVHSHSGFIQDDSAGFAVASSLLSRITGIDTTINIVHGDPELNTITVKTNAGGTATLVPRRGITPRECELIKAIEGENAIYTQNLAIQAFGRIYGQGVSEVATTLQGVCALAVMNSFKRNLGENFLITEETFKNKYDLCGGILIDVDNIPVSLMLVINGTNGGIGPDEDLEGNLNTGDKGRIMAELGADTVPTIVIESKAYIPSMAPDISENRFMIRAEEGIDSDEVGTALYESAKKLNIAAKYEKHLMPINPGSMAKATKNFADSIIEIARKLRTTDSADLKTQYTAQLAQLISEDAGGITFMSGTVNDRARGAGILPGITAVISMVTTDDYIKHCKIPMLNKTELESYIKIILSAIKMMDEKKG